MIDNFGDVEEIGSKIFFLGLTILSRKLRKKDVFTGNFHELENIWVFELQPKTRCWIFLSRTYNWYSSFTTNNNRMYVNRVNLWAVA